MIRTEVDVRFVLDVMFDASMPTAAAVRAIAFVRQYPEHADLVAEVWTRHFGLPLYTVYSEKPVGAVV